MAKQRFLVSTKKPGLEFRVEKVVKLEGDAGLRVSLVGAHDIRFERVINDDILQKYGYAVEIRDVEDSAGAPA